MRYKLQCTEAFKFEFHLFIIALINLCGCKYSHTVEIVLCQIPPLPPKPLTEPKSVANQSKKQLGKSSQMLIGDEFHKDCRSLEK